MVISADDDTDERRKIEDGSLQEASAGRKRIGETDVIQPVVKAKAEFDYRGKTKQNKTKQFLALQDSDATSKIDNSLDENASRKKTVHWDLDGCDPTDLYANN